MYDLTLALHLAYSVIDNPLVEINSISDARSLGPSDDKYGHKRDDILHEIH